MKDNIIGNNIKSARMNAEMTQERLSELLYVGRQTVGKWEKGALIPDIETLIKICSIFSLSLDDLCGTSEQKKNLYVDQVIGKYREYATESDMPFAERKEKYDSFKAEIQPYELTPDALEFELSYFDVLHDTVTSREEFKEMNELIFRCCKNILDVCRDEHLRSKAYFKIAVYYGESKNYEKALKAKEKVLYADMHAELYPIIGLKFYSDEWFKAAKEAFYQHKETQRRIAIILMRGYSCIQDTDNEKYWYNIAKGLSENAEKE